MSRACLGNSPTQNQDTVKQTHTHTKNNKKIELNRLGNDELCQKVLQKALENDLSQSNWSQDRSIHEGTADERLAVINATVMNALNSVSHNGNSNNNNNNNSNHKNHINLDSNNNNNMKQMQKDNEATKTATRYFNLSERIKNQSGLRKGIDAGNTHKNDNNNHSNDKTEEENKQMLEKKQNDYLHMAEIMKNLINIQKHRLK